MTFLTDEALLRAAVALLADENLVWSADFERIRPQMKNILQVELLRDVPASWIVDLAKGLVND